MKKLLKNLAQVKVLKRNSKLNTDEIYILTSESVAKNLYFESAKDILLAHTFFKNYIPFIGEVVEYLFTKKGWMLIVRIHNENDIIDRIRKKKLKSNKIKRALRKKNTGILISEILRIIISGISRQINRNNNRKGTIVKGNFSRYVFRSYSDMLKVIKKMKTRKIKLETQTKKYRSNIKGWTKRIGIRKTKNILSSKDEGMSMSEGPVLLGFREESLYVLRNYFGLCRKPKSSNKS